jgi:hypothetical protein
MADEQIVEAAPEPAPAPAPEPAPEPEPEPAPKTALADPEPAPKDETGAFPENWRDLVAGDDEAAKKRLGRFTSPKDVYDSYINLEKAYKNGADPDPYPDEGSDEDKTKWRKDHGIPEAPTDYKLTLSEGREIPEELQGDIDSFVEHMHARNIPPDVVSHAIDSYMEIREVEQAELSQTDEKQKIETQGKLQELWGTEMKANTIAAYAMLDLAPEGLRDNFMNGRLGDGSAIGNSPEVIEWLSSAMLKINPAATVVPGAGGDTVTSITTEMAEIEAMMGDRNSEYYKGSKSVDLQKRYLALTEAKMNMDARGRG